MTALESDSAWGTSGGEVDDTGAEYSRRRVLAGSAAILGTAAVAGPGVGTGGASTTRQDAGTSVRLDFADDEVEAGETTRLEVVLSEVPDSGLTGWTLYLELTGSGEAGFTGEAEFADESSAAGLDTENTDSDAAAYLIGSDMQGSLDSAMSDLLLGDLEVQAAEEGTVEVDVRVDELTDGNNDTIEVDVGSASFSVSGSAPDLDIGGDDGEDSDDVSDDSMEVDPAAGDGDGSSGDGGNDGDGSSGDGGSDSDGSSGDGGSDSDGSSGDGGSDGDGAGGSDSDGSSDGSDGQPGFGIGAAIGAVLAGTAARVVRRSGVHDADGSE